MLVSFEWDRFGISEQIWAAIIIVVGAIIGIITIIRNKDFAYGLVIIWAYIGILIKHTSPNGFNKMYPAINTIVIITLAFIIAADVYILIKKRVND